MAQIDFYQLSRDPIERVVPLLAAKATEKEARLLLIHSDAGRRAGLAEALWAREAAFLANGEADEPHATRQLVLLAERCEPLNGARIAILADGQWREEAGEFERAILLFEPEQTAAARALWSSLGAGGHVLRIFKQAESGGWREGR